MIENSKKSKINNMYMYVVEFGRLTKYKEKTEITTKTRPPRLGIPPDGLVIRD